jgi:virulence-associated protein VapD
MVIVKIKELIGELYEKNYLLYDNITNHIEMKDSQGILETFKDKSGSVYILTPKAKVKVKIKTQKIHKENWFKNIVPELKAYESLSKDSFSTREIISEKEAIELSQLKIKGAGELISLHGNSRKNFIRLLSDPCLLDHEIPKMKIVFSVPKKNIVTEFNTLMKNNVLTYKMSTTLINFNCFYYINRGAETPITKKSFFEGISKTKPRYR